ncbi:hypothetical protein ZYGR_0I05670 [Zygosaccharomyces rouxii]|uniref:Pre-mRNA-splicing factor SLT11 n=2 Tax=Zygosaccharomyces rouxii TaxID=4956 RepID=C5DU32_ZYGRC|nr:uncharacterized protein ZYRO0C13464g [Zygosaccharomyces rouxii]KAH9201531.1 hypothetical protein LQ764DRAFT_233304 [Zygosaccharomyces rouxii]GAV48270.1 hypothetical protein ZYGR_0I05670 [Zygosaccharomyces rouxii]CAR27293.1 ZYRO0C13464p [Zygosaccharomyces rouxii]
MEVSICSKCLGNGDALTKYASGSQCKVCTGVFDVYAVKQRNSLVKTLVCHRCSQQRNICQCCLLDLSWGVPTELRDRLLSLIHDDPSLKTQEARNDMMRRFLSLKDVKLGGAQITSQTDSLEELKPLLQINKSLQQDLYASNHYLICNLDKSIPKWKVESAVDGIVGIEGSVESVSVNPEARVACITVKDDASTKFVEKLEKCKSKGKMTVRGKLTIDRFNTVVTSLQEPVKLDGFSDNLGIFLQKNVLFAESRRDRETPGRRTQNKPGKPNKVTKRSKRARDLEL